MPSFNDLTGQTFSRLTVISRSTNRGRRTYWDCLCDCGSIVQVNASNIVGGRTKSCGCLQRDRVKESNSTHGMSGSVENVVWNSMKTRCYNKNAEAYAHYGGRGITICDDWSDFEVFYRDMGPRPSARHTIERVDNDKGYSPENCIWDTYESQARNRRVRFSNKYGVTGVGKKHGKWCAYISPERKKPQLWLGTFDSFFDAVCARKSAEARYWS